MITSSGPVAITGASGLIGSALSRSLDRDGIEIRPLVRESAEPGSGEVMWDPARGIIEPDKLRGVAAVVHLAGEPVGRRWTAERKRRIRDSRVNGTRRLAESLAALPEPPAVLVSASAVGYYGDRGDEILDEDSPPGEGFLPETGRGWEQATTPAADAGIRTVSLRFGVVLDRDGGALERLLLPFQLGLGGPIGNGRQWMSWIALEDVVRAIRFAIDTPDLTGATNVVAPEPVRNAEFAKELGKALNRPAVIPVPAAALRVAFGEMADATLLTSHRVVPRRLTSAGFEFSYPRLPDALQAALQHGP
jgi:uncharacterized protein (TIGR01777 family)